jgi:hypothetical protein
MLFSPIKNDFSRLQIIKTGNRRGWIPLISADCRQKSAGDYRFKPAKGSLGMKSGVPAEAHWILKDVLDDERICN